MKEIQCTECGAIFKIDEEAPEKIECFCSSKEFKEIEAPIVA
jgi:DNA-directed RNA polymerase subunit RPC12/RpoP